MTIKINSYQDLAVWQRAMDLVIDCYRIVKSFPKTEQYGLTNQLQRAVVSIPANIAEGHGRKYTKEFLRHLSIAKGSLAELETHMQIAQRLEYIKKEELNRILSKTDEISRMLTGLHKSLALKAKPTHPSILAPRP